MVLGTGPILLMEHCSRGSTGFQRNWILSDHFSLLLLPLLLLLLADLNPPISPLFPPFAGRRVAAERPHRYASNHGRRTVDKAGPLAAR